MIRDPTFRGPDKYINIYIYIYICSIQEIQLLDCLVKRKQKEDNTSRFIAEILGPRAVSVVYVCFVVLLSLDFQAIGAEVFFFLSFCPEKNGKNQSTRLKSLKAPPKKKKNTHPK